MTEPSLLHVLRCHSNNLTFHLLSIYYVPGTVLE